MLFFGGRTSPGLPADICESFGRHLQVTVGSLLGDSWDSFGRHQGIVWATLEIIWTTSGSHMGDIWESVGRALCIVWTTSGSHVEDNWGSFGRHLVGLWTTSRCHRDDIRGYFAIFLMYSRRGCDHKNVLRMHVKEKQAKNKTNRHRL